MREVVIIGGGPAGATAARYLSKLKVKNILIQRDLNFKKPCGGGIRIDAFKEFELDKKVIKKIINEIEIFHKKRKISIDISQNPIAIVERREFDAYLRELAKKEGSEVIEAVFLDLKIFKDYILIKIKKEGKIEYLKASHLIAADGVNSKIRKIVNKDRVDYNLTRYADISRDLNTCQFHFGSKIAGRFYAWAFPHAEGSNIGTVNGGKYFENFLKNLKIDEKIKVKGYKIPNFKNPLFYKDRVFFTGDSGGFVLPFTYEGIYYAMESGKMAAEILGKNGSPFEYEEMWKKKNLNKFKTLSLLQKIFLYNDFTIKFMTNLFANPKIQKEIIKLWLGKREVKIDLNFFYKVIKESLK